MCCLVVDVTGASDERDVAYAFARREYTVNVRSSFSGNL